MEAAWSSGWDEGGGTHDTTVGSLITRVGARRRMSIEPS